jgi:quercetin dioxygenase-like cupin family protein
MRPLIACTLLLLALAPSRAEAQAVPVHQEPLHRLVLDSLRFKVMDVQIPSGDTTLFHLHDAPAFYVAIHVSPTDAQVLGGHWQGVPPDADPGWRSGDVDIDSVYATIPLAHRVTNVGSGPFRLILVTNAAPVSHAVHTEVRQEVPGTPEIMSTWYRQTRMSLAPNAATEWATSSSPVLIVQPGAGRIEVLLGTGSPHTLALPGDWFLVPVGSPYRVMNASRDTAAVVAIQVR